MLHVMQRAFTSVRPTSHTFTTSARIATRVQRISCKSIVMGDSADEKAAKRAKVAEDEGSLEINNAVVVEYETKPLSEIATAPITALQGIGPITEEALKELGVETVTDLAENKFYKMAKAIVALSTTGTGERKEGSKLNINKALMKDSEKMSLSAIAEAPAATLQGLSEEKAKLLEKMNVSTVKDLAELKYANWAEAIVTLAEYEEA